MSPVSGFTDTTPEDVLVDAGLIYVGTPGDEGTPMLLGASVDGFTFDPGKEFREMEFDGKRSPVVGGHRVTGYQSVISGTMLEFSDGQIPVYEPGAVVTAGPPILVTPKDAGGFFVEEDYVQNLWLFLQRGVSGYEKIAFDWALVRKYTLVSKDKDEVKVAVEFLGCVLNTNLGKCPYKISQETALPA
jgi:hypothetical protein